MWLGGAMVGLALGVMWGPEPESKHVCGDSFDAEYIVAVCMDDIAYEVIRGGYELEKFMREMTSEARIVLDQLP
jgi:hypothetical protein